MGLAEDSAFSSSVLAELTSPAAPVATTRFCKNPSQGAHFSPLPLIGDIMPASGRDC